jgi:hypothetical protein
MDDYSMLSEWLKLTYNKMLVLSGEMNKCNNTKEHLTLRQEYLTLCDEWLNVNNVLRERLLTVKTRVEKQVEGLKM